MHGCRMFAGEQRAVLLGLLLGALIVLLLLVVPGVPFLTFLRTLWALPQPRTAQVLLLGVLAVIRQEC